jgi:FkbM family methyltransferase
MSDHLTDILQPARPTAIVDIGANPIEEEPPYNKMLAAGLCDLVGFEPQPEALARLEQMKGPRERYLPYAIGDGTQKTLHVCKSQGMSSILVPDARHLALFNSFPIWGEVTATLPIATRRLDDVAEITAMDFLKMDIQGSELDVIRHGRERLKQAVCLQVEVSFVTLYEGQPAFGEIDTELRQMGFMPHCFQAVKMWPIAPTVIGDNPHKALRQLLEADIVYVRDFSQRENMSAEQWKQLALIAHHIYGSVDLAARAISMAEELGAAPENAVPLYFSHFGKRPN